MSRTRPIPPMSLNQGARRLLLTPQHPRDLCLRGDPFLADHHVVEVDLVDEVRGPIRKYVRRLVEQQRRIDLGKVYVTVLLPLGGRVCPYVSKPLQYLGNVLTLSAVERRGDFGALLVRPQIKGHGESAQLASVLRIGRTDLPVQLQHMVGHRVAHDSHARSSSFWFGTRTKRQKETTKPFVRPLKKRNANTKCPYDVHHGDEAFQNDFGVDGRRRMHENDRMGDWKCLAIFRNSHVGGNIVVMKRMKNIVLVRIRT